MGRWELEVKGPGEWGRLGLYCAALSIDVGSGSRGDVTVVPSLFGDPGREGIGEAPGKGECWVGERVKRNMRASICQNEVWLTNMWDQPSPFLSSLEAPTEDSSVLIRPILSNLGSKFLPFKMPSLLILIFHRPFGRPSSGIFGFTPSLRCGFGAGCETESVTVNQS